MTKIYLGRTSAILRSMRGLDLLTVFLLTFFWQTRMDPLNSYELWDYHIPFIYLTDFLMIALLFVCLSSLRKLPKRLPKLSLLAGLFLMIALAGFFVAKHQVAFWYRWFKLVEMFVLAGLVVEWARKYSRFKILRLISLGMVPLILIGLGEFIIGSSLGLQLIGEWQFTINTPGIAKVVLLNREWLRPYATFPHPNLFGGVSAGLLVWWFGRFITAEQVQERKIATVFVLIFLLGTLLSFSRAAWIGALLALGLVFVRKYQKFTQLPSKFRLMTFLTGIVMFALVVWRSSYLLSWDVLSVTRRLGLSKVAFKMWKEAPLLGVGLNQFLIRAEEFWFVTDLQRFVQPVHNIWLLIAAETGLLGLAVFALFVWRFISKAWHDLSLSLQAVWVVIIWTSLLDHYWWTLQAGMFFLFLTIGLTLASIKDR